MAVSAVLRSFVSGLRSGLRTPTVIQLGRCHGTEVCLVAAPVQPETSHKRKFHSTVRRKDLMEFFDIKKNWGQKEVRSGRSWTKDELRIKSNSDLHKLWFVLYKEKNMLLTMQEECDLVAELFPNPERLDKVEESMVNLQDVIKERDTAVKLLEIGITGDAPTKECYSGLGRRYMHKYEEHLMPYWRNPRHYAKRYVVDKPRGFTREFLLRLWEKNRRQKRKALGFQKHLLHEARKEYPGHPIWAEKDVKDLTYEEVYHSKMSD
ncbi:hypothetical protein RvY_10237 [Ramazzottius varieornatus]|uniref:Large ribosomal subunit protein uL29m n=1 Tax=Ramazzottius varieornatus TaxID=947166 RepID=A0A1D1VC46_RAMVA|nr:hypothetical protein RvY_10237 [Ramazzottius varieornatus]